MVCYLPDQLDAEPFLGRVQFDTLNEPLDHL